MYTRRLGRRVASGAPARASRRGHSIFLLHLSPADAGVYKSSKAEKTAGTFVCCVACFLPVVSNGSAIAEGRPSVRSSTPLKARMAAETRRSG